MDARGEYGELAAIYANGRTSILLPSERLCPGDPPGWTASLREGRELFFPDDRGPKELGGNETNGANTPARSAVPVLSEGRTVAVLAAVDEAARSWPETDRQLHREVAERTWAAVERARTETALRESNAQREHLLAAARAAQAEAEEANRAKDEFLATLSHELRTPLAAILLWSGAIKSGAIQPSELGRAVEAIVQSAKSQSRLIEDLLDLSRLTSRRLLLAVQNTSIEQLLRAAVEVVRPGAEAKNIGLELDLPGELGVAVLDPTRIQQVLWNLLSNGIKFTPPRGRVTLRARKKDRQLEIEVADTGEGIPLNFVPHLFQRFRQADMRETRKYAGLGIGLALSRYIVELHNGTIEAHSDGPGTGACFSVRIPWLEVDPTKTRTDGGAAPPQSLSSLHDVRVLLVEDDESTRDAMRWTLELVGAQVVALSSGADAIAIAEAHAREETRGLYDVVLCDIGLEGMSGYEVVEQIAVRCEARGVPLPPVCAVSAHARDVDRRKAIDAGFDFHLAKPVTGEALVAAVEDLRSIAMCRVSDRPPRR
jgi:signal transduction histidine kinase/CheY-like chemotaxis protein